MATPSIELFPSAYKTSKLYSQLPTNGNGDFTFSRGSTATRVNESGLIETVAANIPRLDYTNSVCPVLLLEPSSTNLLLRSEELNTTWTKNRVTILSDQIIAPDGELTADKVVETVDNNSHSISQIISITPSDYTQCIFAKKGERDILQIAFGGKFSATDFANFDLTNGVISLQVGLIDAKIIDYGNGWYLCTATVNSIVTDVEAVYFQVQNSSTATRFEAYTGDITKGLYLWGADMEALSYSTSYIPTTSGTVTRSADVCNNSGTVSDFNSEEGVFYVKLAALHDALTNRIITISDGTMNNRIEISYSTVSNRIKGAVNVGGVQIASMLFVTSDISITQEIAVKWKTNDFALWVDGVEVATDSSGTTAAAGTLDEASFDDGSGAFDFYGKVEALKVYKTIQEAIDDGIIS